MRSIVIIGALLCSLLADAHQAEISTTMLVEQASGEWIVQLRSSLTAFQHEVKTRFPDKPYGSPEEFEEQVIVHLRSNLFISFNNEDAVSFDNAFVKLGHETNAVLQLNNVPDSIWAVSVTNTSFKDINRDQSALIVLKKDFLKEQFVLNEANDRTAELVAVGNKFILKKGEPVSESAPTFGKGVLVLFTVVTTLLLTLLVWVLLARWKR